MARFHYAFKVKDIPSTRRFYIDLLGCNEGRSTDTWIDFDFFGNQLSAHVNTNLAPLDYCGKVDGVAVPMPHFGALLSNDQFNEIRAKLENADVKFIISPLLRYEGKVGEQWTMFVLDFSENPIEFKSFTNDSEVFSV
jgi:extradiol dioxygenase family protein